jgi:integrase
MAKDLTVKALENLKPGPARREVPDGHTRGLFYVLQPSGSASWAYRYRFAGKTKKLTLGPYPALDLKASRQMASEAAQALARGDDPAAAKQVAKVTARTAAANPERDLVETVAETFMERYAKKQTREKSWRETERLLNREVVAPWRGRRLSAIKRADVHELLDRIVDRAPIVANRTLGALRQMCTWAVERGLTETSPCEKVRAPAPERSRDRVLTDDEIRAAWAAFEDVGWPFGALAQMLLLTGQRLREVGNARWQEVDFAAKTWTIPKERVKNGIAHEIPLSEAALRILGALPRIEAGRRPASFIFTVNGHSAVSDYAGAKVAFDKGAPPMPHWTFHDLRRTAASGMAGLGIAPHVVEAVLNHKSGSIRGVAAIYNRYNYGAEKRAALEAWGRSLDALISGAPAGNVVELAKARA